MTPARTGDRSQLFRQIDSVPCGHTQQSHDTDHDGLSRRRDTRQHEGAQRDRGDGSGQQPAHRAAVQINTGRGCHLDAHMIGHALVRLVPEPAGILFIENVGNLVCPAAFDLGENHKVAILSVTEGEDKPLKYPDMFAAADVMVLGKVDLLPYLDFDAERCVEYARRINPEIEILRLSAKTGEGMDAWIAWIGEASARARTARPVEESHRSSAAG